MPPCPGKGRVLSIRQAGLRFLDGAAVFPTNREWKCWACFNILYDGSDTDFSSLIQSIYSKQEKVLF